MAKTILAITPSNGQNHRATSLLPSKSHHPHKVQTHCHHPKPSSCTTATSNHRTIHHSLIKGPDHIVRVMHHSSYQLPPPISTTHGSNSHCSKDGLLPLLRIVFFVHTILFISLEFLANWSSSRRGRGCLITKGDCPLFSSLTNRKKISVINSKTLRDQCNFRN